MKKVFLGIVSVLLIATMAGCNSGVMKGLGSDVERMGQGMQD